MQVVVFRCLDNDVKYGSTGSKITMRLTRPNSHLGLLVVAWELGRLFHFLTASDCIVRSTC